MNKKSVKDINIRGKKVIMRVDFNVPIKDGIISDNARITAALPTIKYILDQGASLILMSHLGRPKGEIKKEFSLVPCALELGKLLGKKVLMAPDCIGSKTAEMASLLKEGELLLLENVRFHKQEDDKKDTEGRKSFARQLASLADVYVNDAFGTAHREHASTANIASFLPSACGFLMEKEIAFLGKAVHDPHRPLTAILSGAKISDKIPIINNLLQKADNIIIGGGMAYTFFKAMNLNTGSSLVDAELIETCRDFLSRSGGKIILPVDNMISGKFDFGSMQCVEPLSLCGQSIPDGKMGLDIGSETIKKFKDIILKSKTIVWNGPMGVFECADTAKGTFAVAEILAAATANGATTIIGGGDSASAVKKAGLRDKMSHVSTGGGASLEFLEGKELPGVAVLPDK